MAQHHHDSYALVTGATAGIGLALARTGAEHGLHLVLVARHQDELSRVAEDLRAQHPVKVSTIAVDLSDTAGVGHVIAELNAQNLTIDILINNAGFGNYGPFLEHDWAREAALLHLNIVALTELTHALAPAMIQRGSGKILNLASTAAFLPGPLMATYYASKAYVLSLSDALSEELKGTGVTVTALCPGPTRTRFAEQAGVSHSRMFNNPFVMHPEQVARAGFRGMLRGQQTVTPGLPNKITTWSRRFLPRPWLAILVRRVEAHV